MSEGENTSSHHVVNRTIGKNTLTIDCGKYAKQAGGAAMVSYGDTVVLVAVTSGPRPEHLDFFPLTVDYREKTSAAGKFPGGFIKREGRPSTEEILSCRLIDRSIRPLFPEGYREEVSVSAIILSADQENEPDILAMIGASASLAISDIPFEGPVGSVRIGLINDKLVVNPPHSEMQESKLNLILAGTSDNITMVEAGANEVSEGTMLEAFEIGHEVIREITAAIN
ncbi:MAG: polyribonucleotide nucleotidyltransferase, partial [Planctomycetota bacterium]